MFGRPAHGYIGLEYDDEYKYIDDIGSQRSQFEGKGGTGISVGRNLL